MAVIIRDKKVYSRVQNRMGKLSDKSLRLLGKGKLSESKKVESKIDKIYKDNYNKMFKIVPNKK